MDCRKSHLIVAFPILLLACGCSESGSFVDYASLEAAPPDFVSNGTTDFSPAAAMPSAEPDSADTSKQEPVAVAEPAAANSGASSSEVTDGDAESSSTDVDGTKPDSLLEPPTQVSTEPAADSVAAGSVDTENTESTEPREIKLLVKDKRFRSEDDSLRVSYDDIDLLKVLNMEPVPVDAPKHFPDWLQQLDGKRIRIRGFMYPTFEATGLKRFTLARDNGICCFVRQPMIYDIIGVDMADGTTTKYIDNKPFDVEGVFQIQPEADDTELFQLYRIADAKVLN